MTKSYTFGKSHPIQGLPRPLTDMEKHNSLVLSEKTSVKKDMTCKYSQSINSGHIQLLLSLPSTSNNSMEKGTTS